MQFLTFITIIVIVGLTCLASQSHSLPVTPYHDISKDTVICYSDINMVGPCNQRRTNPGILEYYCSSIAVCLKQIASIGSTSNFIYVTPDLYDNTDCPGTFPSTLTGNLTISSTVDGEYAKYLCNEDQFMNIDIVSDSPNQSQLSISFNYIILRGVNNYNGSCISLNTNYRSSGLVLNFYNSQAENCMSMSANGGFIYSYGWYINIVNSILFGNSAYLSGGAIYSERGEVTIAYSLVANNTAGSGTSVGGAIYGYNIISTKSNFTDNVSYQNAGAIYGKFINMVDCIISGNVAANNGGAILADDSGAVVIYYSTISSNVAYQSGGAIYLYETSLDTNDVQFNSNVAHGNLGGGAIYLNSPFLLCQQVNFTNNNAINGNGGAIYLDSNSSSSELQFERSIFVGNNAANTGGAIFFLEYPSISGGWFFNSTSSETEFKSFPVNALKSVNVVNVNIPTLSTRYMVPIVDDTNSQPMYKLVGVIGSCVWGTAVVGFGGRVQSCKCYQGWSGSNCDTPSSL